MLPSSRASAPRGRGPSGPGGRPVAATMASRPRPAPPASRAPQHPTSRPSKNPLQQGLNSGPLGRPGVLPVAQLEPMLRGEIQKLHAYGPETAELEAHHKPLYEGALEGQSDVTMSKEVGDAIHPVVRDAVAEKAMRKTQALPHDVMNHLTPTMSRFMLKNKVAIVTGGARGLGLNMAQALCESGIKAVAIFDVQRLLGETMAKELSQATNIPVKFYTVDIVNQRTVDQAVREVVQDFGTIDILINSAGVALSNRPAEKHSIKDFQKTLEINLVGAFRVARAVGDHMKQTAHTNGNHQAQSRRKLPGHPDPPKGRPKDRSIVMIASMSASIVNYPQEQCAYNASKAGVVQMAKSLSAEWAQHGIRVNCISPGYMDTALNRTPDLEKQKEIWRDRTPQKRLGAEDELDNLVVYLAGEGSRFMTGADLLIDGGYSVY